MVCYVFLLMSEITSVFAQRAVKYSNLFCLMEYLQLNLNSVWSNIKGNNQQHILQPLLQPPVHLIRSSVCQQLHGRHHYTLTLALAGSTSISLALTTSSLFSWLFNGLEEGRCLHDRFRLPIYYQLNPTGRSRWPRMLRIAGIDVCYLVEVSATGQSRHQRSRTECGVSECDLGTSTMKRPKPTRGRRAIKKNPRVHS